MSENELDGLMRQADIARKEAMEESMDWSGEGGANSNETPRAVAGIWTPWAQVLCFRCHGASGPITSEKIEANSSPRTGEPESEDDYGEVLCHCDKCETPIWLRSDVGKIRSVAEIINKYDDDIVANLGQTGGMCSAVYVERKGDDRTVLISALDGPFFAATFPNEEAATDHAPDHEQSLAWNTEPRLVAVVARGLLGVEDDSVAVKVAVEFSDRVRGWLSDEEVAEVIRRNRNEHRPGVCHTHDFCDANDAMADAFEAVEEDPTPDDETPERERCDRLWGLAWDLAKVNEFNL